MVTGDRLVKVFWKNWTTAVIAFLNAAGGAFDAGVVECVEFKPVAPCRPRSCAPRRSTIGITDKPLTTRFVNKPNLPCFPLCGTGFFGRRETPEWASAVTKS